MHFGERERLNGLIGTAHGMALLLVLIPVMDLVSRTLPVEWGSASWRFSALGLALGSLVTPILGLGLGAGAAAVLRQPTALRAYGLVLLVLGVVTLAGLALFALDVIQVRAALDDAQRRDLRHAGLRAALAGLGSALVALWMGVSAVRLAGALRRDQARAVDDRREKLVIGQR